MSVLWRPRYYGLCIFVCEGIWDGCNERLECICVCNILFLYDLTRLCWEMTESTGEATPLWSSQWNLSGNRKVTVWGLLRTCHVRCEYQNNICQYKPVVIMPKIKFLEQKCIGYWCQNLYYFSEIFVHNFHTHFYAIEFFINSSF